MSVKKILRFDKQKQIIDFIQRNSKFNKKKEIDIALPGGTSWTSIYKKLANEIKCKKINIYLTDERCTSKINYSNYNLVKNIFKKKKFIINKFYINNSAKKSLLNYNKKLPEKMDLILASLGNDGHVFSWFDKKKIVSTKKTLYSVSSGKNKFNRISLSESYVNRCAKVFLLVNQNKKSIFEEMYSSKKKYYPVKKLKIDYLIIHKSIKIK